MRGNMAGNIWDEMRRMQRKINRSLRGFDKNPWQNDWEEDDLSGYRRAWIDAKEESKEFIIRVELPGIEKEDIELKIEDKNLIIKVEKDKEERDLNKDFDMREKTFVVEKSYIGFYRSIPMPDNADFSNVDAEYKNGVLKINVGKKHKEDKKGKTIKIK
jgi:HSP20 family protein